MVAPEDGLQPQEGASFMPGLGAQTCSSRKLGAGESGSCSCPPGATQSQDP